MGDNGAFRSRPNQPSDVKRRWLRPASRLARPIVAWLIAFGSVLLGSIVAVWPSEIRDATRAAISGPRGAPNFWVLSFWAAVLAWAYTLYRRLKVDHQEDDDRISELLRAIHRVPNYRVIERYPDFYRTIADSVEATATANDDDKLNSLEAGLKSVLTVVAGLAAEFARASDDNHYGGNIMLVAKPQPGSHDPFDEELIRSLIFYDKDGGNPGALKAVLYVPSPLVVPSTNAQYHGRSIPLIALPVPQKAQNSRGHRLALPGAPWALLSGTQSLVEDSRQMSQSCQDFARPILDEVDRYFGDEGDGKGVRSFVSYRIGDELTPVGVLNIDSDHTHVLGPEPEYYATFYALISPVLRLLRKPVTEYARLSSAKGLYLHRAEPAAAVALAAVSAGRRSGTGKATNG